MSAVTLAWFAGIVLAILVLTLTLGIKFLLVVLGLCAALYLLGRLLFTDDRRPDEIHYVKTRDGWDIGIWRIRPAKSPAHPVPVIFQHGLGANHRNFDLDDDYSVARYLAKEGYDCFIPALRGCGPSAMRKWRHPGKWDIDFDKFVDLDVPAVFDKVRQITGAPKAHFIGMSMGAMIGYAIAQGPLGEKLQSLTAVAGPCFFRHMTQFKALVPLGALIRRSPVIRQTIFTTIQSPLYRLFPRLAGRQELNSENVDGHVIARACVNLMEDLPAKLLLQFGKWVGDGEFGSHKGGESWEKNLHKISAPIYCLGGSADQFCRPECNDKVIEKVSSVKKRYQLFSKSNGGLADYGHGDIVVGRTAPAEVYPTILQWLGENDGDMIPAS